MIRKIIHIDEAKCNGCGACAAACHEGAISMINGKARLLREDYCDGLGDCLPTCPTGAITFEEREAAEYDAQALQAHQRGAVAIDSQPGGCPGMQARTLERASDAAAPCSAPKPVNRLAQWPVQIKLAPVRAPYFDGARLLIAADCTAYAYAAFHEEFMRGHVTLIGCSKLDYIDYAEKLAQILCNNEIKSLRVVRMEVPCCGGIEEAARTALRKSGKFIPWQVVTLSTDGRVLED